MSLRGLKQARNGAWVIMLSGILLFLRDYGRNVMHGGGIRLIPGSRGVETTNTQAQFHIQSVVL